MDKQTIARATIRRWSYVWVLLQLNWDTNIGPAEEGDRFTLNIQPVVPISLNEKWNMICRSSTSQTSSAPKVIWPLLAIPTG